MLRLLSCCSSGPGTPQHDVADDNLQPADDKLQPSQHLHDVGMPPVQAADNNQQPSGTCGSVQPPVGTPDHPNRIPIDSLESLQPPCAENAAAAVHGMAWEAPSAAHCVITVTGGVVTHQCAAHKTLVRPQLV